MAPALFPPRVAVHGLSNGSQHPSRFVPIFISSWSEEGAGPAGRPLCSWRLRRPRSRRRWPPTGWAS
eukprot:scaffold45499_cov225-Isochrysis_galbana.AAC.1